MRARSNLPGLAGVLVSESEGGERVVLAVSRTESSPVTDLEEIRCVRRMREGDLEAFERLHRKYASRVFGLCLRMVRDRDLADELAQEAFVRAWQKRGLFRGDRPIGPWLLTLASRVVVSHARKRRRTEEREQAREDVEHLAGARATRSGTRAAAASLPGSLDLERAIAALPERARHVFVLHEIEGFRHGEIAAAMGVATGTTKAQLHRARKLLREWMT